MADPERFCCEDCGALWPERLPVGGAFCFDCYGRIVPEDDLLADSDVTEKTGP